MFNYTKKKLSYQLLTMVLSIYFAITIIMTAVHMYGEYLYTKDTILNELKILEKTYKPAFEQSIWELNTEQTQAISEGIVNLPTITGIEVHENNGNIIDKRGEVLKSQLKHTFVVEYKNKNIHKEIAEVTIYSNNSVIFDRIKVGFYFIVINALIKSAILILLIVIVFNKILIRPLDQLTQKVSKINLENIEAGSQDIDIVFKEKNELFIFQNTFNKMLATISDDLKVQNTLTKEIRRESYVNKFLAETSKDLLKMDSYDKMYDIILEKSKEMTNSPYGFVGYIDQDNGFLVCPTLTKEISEDCAIDNKNIVFEKFTGLWGWVLDNKEPLFTNDPKNDPRSSGTPAGHIPIKRFISVPVLIGDKLIGQISLANSTSDYTQKDIQDLERLANLYAFSLQKKRLNDIKVEQEEQVYRSRNAAMGEIITMLSHQWSQPLQTISMLNNNIQADIAFDNLEKDEMKKYCDDMEKQIQYLSDTLSNFKNLFRPSNKEKQIVNLNETLDNTLTIMGRKLEENKISITKQYDTTIEPISTYQNEMVQIFLNILKNATEFLIKREIKDKEIYIETKNDEDNTITISIEDNAGGIKVKNIFQVFEPYFTTEHESIGKGMGLYISKVIAEKYLNGTISVENTSKGAKFTISIKSE